jgi:hypothetical protein
MTKRTSNDARWQGRARPALAALLALLGVLPATGCTGDCPVLESCDIRRAKCQAHTTEVATCLSGDTAVHPALVVVDAQVYIEEQIAGDTDTESDDQRDLRRGLALLNLMPAQLDAPELERQYWDTVGAFYDPDTKQVTILDRGQPLDGGGAVTTLLHELIHALQDDREQRSPEVARDDDDGAMALTGIVEGEAVLYQDLARARGFGVDPDDIDWQSVFFDYQASSWDQVINSDAAYLLAWRYFPYAFGGRYVRDAWADGGNARVRELFAQPPTATRQILAGYGLPPPAAPGPELAAAWREDLDTVGSPVLPAQYEPVTRLHLGAWLFEIFKQRRLRREASGLPSGSGLLGDVLSVFREPATGDVSIFWRLRFDDPERAAVFRAQVANIPAVVELGHVQYDRDVVLGASTRQPLDSAFVRSIVWEAVPAASTEPEQDPPAQPSALLRRLTCPWPFAPR